MKPNIMDKAGTSMICEECGDKVYATVEREMGGFVYAEWQCCGERYTQDLGCINPEKAEPDRFSR